MKTIPSRPQRGVTCLLFALTVALGGGTEALGQTQLLPGAPAAPAQPRIGTITIKFVGSANVSEQVVRANMQIREGTPLEPTLVDRDIKQLNRTGLFTNIAVSYGAISNGVIDITLEVEPRYRILAINYNGAKRVDRRTLEKETKSRVNLAVDDNQVADDARKIIAYYEKAGFNQVQVRYDITLNRGTGYGSIDFNIVEGPKSHIGEIRFSGNAQIDNAELRKVIKTKKWGLVSFATGTGRFKEDVFQEDLDIVRDYYREKGFLDVEIPLERVEFNYPKPERLELVIGVVEGRQYHVGEVSFSGNTVHPADLLKRVVKQRPGQIYVPSKLDRDLQTISDFYARDGYLDTRVRLDRKANLATGAIDLNYILSEGEKFTVESIKIEGNTKTKSTVILRELTLSPGEVFNTVYMKVSKLRLENTRFFDTVDIKDEQTQLPGRRNMTVDVTEGRTGSLTFGAGFNSVDKATMFIEMAQSNFDLFGRKQFFQGAGQKFRIRLQLGSESSEAAISFEEPWLFQQQLALGFSLFRTTSDYDTTLYREIRQGFEVYLRRRLIPRIALDGQITYRFETITIDQIADTAPVSVQLLAGDSNVSRVSTQFLIDTRDRNINPTTGQRLQLDLTVAGGPLGGAQSFYSAEFRGAQFLPVFAWHTQVLTLLERAGVIDSYGDTRNLPYYERFFLGGQDDLRGFEFREVGPKDTFGNALGAKSYAMFTAEFGGDVVAPIRWAVFYDAGFANANAFDFAPTNFSDNWGVGIRMFVAGAPLRLDYGFPLTVDKFNGKGAQFNFSFGTRF